MSRTVRACVVCFAMVVLAGCEPPEVRLADGSGTSWKRLEGQWLVVNYWAEWCAPCREEIPELNKLHEADDVIVLGVNFDGLQGEALTELMTRMDIRFPVLVNDPGGRWDQMPPSVLPSTLVIGPDGKLRDVLVGPQTFESLARAVELRAEV